MATKNYKGQITITDLNDGDPGADGSQGNLFGYDNKITSYVSGDMTVHTNNGIVGLCTAGSSGYVFVNIFMDAFGAVLKANTKYSIHATVCVTNVSNMPDTFTLAIGNDHCSWIAGTGTRTNVSCGTDYDLSYKLLTNSDATQQQLYFFLSGLTASSSKCLIEIKNLKIEDATDILGIYTPFDGLAFDSIPQGQNLLLNTKDFDANWSQGSGASGADLSLIDNAIQGNKAVYYLGGTYLDNPPSNYHIIAAQSITGKLKASTWYTFSFYLKGNGCLSSWIRIPISEDYNLVLCDEENARVTTGSSRTYNHTLTSNWTLHAIKFKTPSTLTEETTVSVDFTAEPAYNTSTYSFYIAMPKLEEGDKATTWQQNEADRKGGEGLSAYEVYVKNGGTLSESAWLTSLIGASGKSVKTITEYYAINADKSNYPTIPATPQETADWKTTINQPTSEKPYLWNYEVSKDEDGNVIATTTPVIIGNYAANGKGISGVEEAYYASASSTAPGATEEGSPTSAAAGFSKDKPYLYNRERIKYDNGTTGEWDAWQQISYYGQDGKDALIADLSNEMDSIATTTDEELSSEQILYTTFSMYYGSTKQTLTILGTSSTDSDVEIDAAASTGVVTCKFPSGTVFNKTIEITITGTCSYGTLSKVFTVNPIKAAKAGKNAIIYQLVPSVSVIQIGKDQSTRKTTSLTCGITMTDGSAVSTLSALPTGYSLYEEKDGNGTLTALSINAESAYRASATKNVTLYLKNGSVIVDKETIPVVIDGAKGDNAEMLTLECDRTIITVDQDGNVKDDSDIEVKAILCNLTGAVSWVLEDTIAGTEISSDVYTIDTTNNKVVIDPQKLQKGYDSATITATLGDYTASIGLSFSQDGEDADAIQPNLFGYGTWMNEDLWVHTKTGIAYYGKLKGTSTAYQLYFRKDSNINSKWAKGTYAISGTIKTSQLLTVQIGCDHLDSSKATKGSKSFTIPAGGEYDFAYKFSTTDDDAPYFLFYGYANYATLIDITNLKFEEASKIRGRSTMYNAVADDGIPQGQNLLLRSGDFASNWTIEGTKQTDACQGNTAIVQTASTDEYLNLAYYNYSFKANTWYSVSWWAKASVSGATCGVIAQLSDYASFASVVVCDQDGATAKGTSSMPQNQHALTTDWVRHTLTFRTNSAVTGVIRWFILEADSAYDVYMSMPKLEEGEKVTDWGVNEADKIGSQIRTCGEYDASTTYYNDIYYRDVVEYKDSFYAVAKGVTSVIGQTPSDSSSYWEKFSSFGNVATDILMTQKAWASVLSAINAHIDELIVSRLQTVVTGGASVSIEGGIISVWKQGNTYPNIRFGIDGNYAVLNYYDNDGTLLYNLGPDGIISQASASGEEKYTFETVSLTFISASTMAGTAVSSLGSKYKFHLGWKKVGNVKMYYDIDTDAYDLTEPSADDGIVLDKASTSGNAIADGWYQASIVLGVPSKTTGETVYYCTCYHYTGGFVDKFNDYIVNINGTQKTITSTVRVPTPPTPPTTSSSAEE